jgi:hypothetical protein
MYHTAFPDFASAYALRASADLNAPKLAEQA